MGALRRRLRQPGGEVSSDYGKIGIGSRPERLAHPHVELVLVQHALHKRGLEQADYLLAVDM